MFMTIGASNNISTAPYGGRQPVSGTNPVAFSVPRSGGPAVTLDYATSAIAMGKVKITEANGQPRPEGVALDRDRNPTTDPHAVADGGMLVPFSGHKGYALSVIAELLANAVIGADEVNDHGTSGILMLALDTTAFRSAESYDRAGGSIADRYHAVAPAPGVDRVRLPGQGAAEQRARRQRDGVPVPDTVWAQVLDIAVELGIDDAADLART